MKIIAYIFLTPLVLLGLFGFVPALYALFFEGNLALEMIIPSLIYAALGIGGIVFVHEKFQRKDTAVRNVEAAKSSKVLQILFVLSLLFMFSPFLISIIFALLGNSDDSVGAIGALVLITVPLGVLSAMILGILMLRRKK